MNYNIRRREKNDCKDIAHVVTIAWNETYKGIVPDEFLKGLYKNEEERVISSFNNFDENDNHQFVLLVNNRIIGFINVGVSEDNDYYSYGEIFALYIINGYKGNGYGKKLLEMGIDELKDMGFNKIVVGCLDGNKSNEFYKHMGGNFIKTRIFEKLNLLENVYIFDNI